MQRLQLVSVNSSFVGVHLMSIIFSVYVCECVCVNQLFGQESTRTGGVWEERQTAGKNSLSL